MEASSLIVVGTGICAARQMSIEAIAAIQAAQKVFYVAADAEAESLIQDLNPRSESLVSLYNERKARKKTYAEMVERILTSVYAGVNTCVALYGHPGVFAYPAHEAIRKARLKGYKALMQPGISAQDCLFADLGIDPGSSGCQSCEASDFLINRRITDPSSHLILWQTGVLGDAAHTAGKHDLRVFPKLLERLGQLYPASHEVIIYEAAMLMHDRAKIIRVALSDLAPGSVTPASTLYIAPLDALTPEQGLEQRYLFSKDQGVMDE